MDPDDWAAQADIERTAAKEEEDEEVSCLQCGSYDLDHTPGVTGYSLVRGVEVEQEAPGWYQCRKCGHCWND